MKVLVAGGCGFLGSHVCELFIRKGWEVVAYDNLTKFEVSRIEFGDQKKIRDYNRRHVESIGAKLIQASITDLKALEPAVSGCDYIINCAAQPTMTLSSVDPRLDFETNVVGTLNLLEMARKEHIPIASCSSIHVYGTGINESLVEVDGCYARNPMEIDESHPVMTGQLTPLHASKRSAEIYMQTYSDTFRMRTANFRLTGIYGPRQFGSEDHGWVSLLAIKTMLGLPIQLIGTGKQVRDILYVTDAAQAFLDWFEAECPSGTYNIGGGIETAISVLWCIQELKELFEKEQTILSGGAREGDLLYFVCDSSRALEVFGWAPSVPYEVGLKGLVEWLKANKTVFRA